MSNSSKPVTETVQCGNMVVKAVVDTGAVITVISPKLLTCTEFKLDSWYGPNIVMANGTTVSPIGAAYITVTVHNKLVTGTAFVMHMEGMDLLLGNDFLKQFGKLHIDYQASKTLLTVGDLSSNLIEPQRMEFTEANKFPTTEEVNIPSFSIQHVPILSLSEEKIQLFTPSQSLETIVEDADRNSVIPVATPDTIPTIARPGTSEPQRSRSTDIVQQHHNNHNDLTDLWPRRRLRPNFLSLWLPYCFLLIFSSGPFTSAVIVWDTVLFNEQPGIAMSESSWKIVTEWTPKEELQTISSVELLITQLSDIAARHRRDATSFHAKDVSNAFRDTSSFMAAGKLRGSEWKSLGQLFHRLPSETFFPGLLRPFGCWFNQVPKD